MTTIPKPIEEKHQNLIMELKSWTKNESSFRIKLVPFSTKIVGNAVFDPYAIEIVNENNEDYLFILRNIITDGMEAFTGSWETQVIDDGEDFWKCFYLFNVQMQLENRK